MRKLSRSGVSVAQFCCCSQRKCFNETVKVDGEVQLMVVVEHLVNWTEKEGLEEVINPQQHVRSPRRTFWEE